MLELILAQQDEKTVQTEKDRREKEPKILFMTPLADRVTRLRGCSTRNLLSRAASFESSCTSWFLNYKMGKLTILPRKATERWQPPVEIALAECGQQFFSPHARR